MLPQTVETKVAELILPLHTQVLPVILTKVINPDWTEAAELVLVKSNPDVEAIYLILMSLGDQLDPQKKIEWGTILRSSPNEKVRVFGEYLLGNFGKEPAEVVPLFSSKPASEPRD